MDFKFREGKTFSDPLALTSTMASTSGTISTTASITGAIASATGASITGASSTGAGQKKDFRLTSKYRRHGITGNWYPNFPHEVGTGN
jgi:hypothetical protein